MENGKYRFKEKLTEGSLEIEVRDGVAYVTSVGKQFNVWHLQESSWERITDERENPTFRVGDKVKLKDGTAFSHGSFVATVGSIECDRVYFRETGTWAYPEYLGLV